MSGRINPREDDLGEMRGAVRETSRRNGEWIETGDADLEPFFQGPGVDHSRPYLEGLLETYGAQLVILEWLECLISISGRSGTDSALEFYESNGWLSTKSRAELDAFVDGVGTTDAREGSIAISDHREPLVRRPPRRPPSPVARRPNRTRWLYQGSLFDTVPRGIGRDG